MVVHQSLPEVRDHLRLWAFYSGKEVYVVGNFHQGVQARWYMDIGEYPFGMFIWVVSAG